MAAELDLGMSVLFVPQAPQGNAAIKDKQDERVLQVSRESWDRRDYQRGEAKRPHPDPEDRKGPKASRGTPVIQSKVHQATKELWAFPGDRK